MTETTSIAVRPVLAVVRTLALLWLTASGAGAQAIHAHNIHLSKGQAGAAPAAFEFQPSGGAMSTDMAVDWSVVRTSGPDEQPAIRRSASNRNAPPTLAIYRPVSADNVKVRFRFKFIKGQRPMAGIAVRVVNPNDYYVVRVSLVEGRVSLDHVIGDTIEEIAGVDANLYDDHWQTLEVIADGPSFKISLDDTWVVTAFEYAQLASGRVALWSDRDSTILFDRIEVTPLTSDTNKASGDQPFRAGG